MMNHPSLPPGYAYFYGTAGMMPGSFQYGTPALYPVRDSPRLSFLLTLLFLCVFVLRNKASLNASLYLISCLPQQMHMEAPQVNTPSQEAIRPTDRVTRVCLKRRTTQNQPMYRPCQLIRGKQKAVSVSLPAHQRRVHLISMHPCMESPIQL